MRVEEQEQITLVDGKSRRYAGPRELLFDDLLRALPLEDQITQVALSIEQHWSDGFNGEEQAVGLIGTLERILGEDKAAFRGHLRFIYSRLPAKGVVDHYWNDPEQRNYQIDEIGDVAVNLKLAILEQVIKGWSTVRRRYEPLEQNHFFRRQYDLEPDAEGCFRFVCDAYTSAENEGRIRKGTLALFEGVHMPEPRLLDQWILDDKTPNGIVNQLLHAQLELEGVEVAQHRLSTSILPI